MAKELEYKYLVKDNSFLEMATESYAIVQGYLSRAKGRSVRVRTFGDKAYFTVKGPNMKGIGRDEYEYEIPVSDALELLKLCPPPVLQKTRYIALHEGNRWEVDVFHGDLEGLVTAELEVPSADYEFSLPPFVGRDVSDDRRFRNSRLTTFEALKPAL